MSAKGKSGLSELSPRSSHMSTEERWSLVILGKEDGNRPVLRYAWAVAWVIIGVIVMREADRLGDHEEIRRVLFIFMAFWAYYLFRIFRAIRWQQVGKEMLMMKDGLLIHKNAFGSIGRSRKYELSVVQPMRLKEPTTGFATLFEDSFFSNGTGVIELPIAAHSLLIGKRLPEAEALKIMSRFNQELKQRVKSH